MTIILSVSLAQPVWNGAVVISGGIAAVSANVSGESPLRISIPAGARISGASYANGTALFNSSFSYSYSSGQMLADSQGEKVFIFALDQPQEFSYSLSVALPPGGAAVSSTPMAAYVTDGKAISARWQGNASQRRFILRYLPPAPIVKVTHTGTSIADKSIFLPGIILAFLLGYFLAAGTATALLQRIRHITAHLSDEEKSIVYLLRNGPLEQSKIQKKLGFSKAKLSRTLRSMEERKIIEKVPKGKTNLISIK